MCAFALLESLLLLGLICFWTNGIYSTPCSCHQKLLFCKMLGVFGCLIFPQEQLLRNAKDMMSGSAEGWIMNCFPKLNKSGSTASLSQVPGWLDLSKFIPQKTAVCIPPASTSPPQASVWICKSGFLIIIVRLLEELRCC